MLSKVVRENERIVLEIRTLRERLEGQCITTTEQIELEAIPEHGTKDSFFFFNFPQLKKGYRHKNTCRVLRMFEVWEELHQASLYRGFGFDPAQHNQSLSTILGQYRKDGIISSRNAPASDSRPGKIWKLADRSKLVAKLSSMKVEPLSEAQIEFTKNRSRSFKKIGIAATLSC